MRDSGASISQYQSTSRQEISSSYARKIRWTPQTRRDHRALINPLSAYQDDNCVSLSSHSWSDSESCSGTAMAMNIYREVKGKFSKSQKADSFSEGVKYAGEFDYLPFIASITFLILLHQWSTIISLAMASRYHLRYQTVIENDTRYRLCYLRIDWYTVMAVEIDADIG